MSQTRQNAKKATKSKKQQKTADKSKDSDLKDKRSQKASQKKAQAKSQATDVSENQTTEANETSQDPSLSEAQPIAREDMIRHKKPTVAERRVIR